MNGATAELCARTMSAPIRKRAINIGTSHHLLLLQKKENNPQTIPKRPAVVRATLVMPMLLPNCSERIAAVPDDLAHNVRSPVRRPHFREGRDDLDQCMWVLSLNRTRYLEKQNCPPVKSGVPPHQTLPPSLECRHDPPE